MVELVPSLLRQELAALAANDERIDGRGRWDSRDIKLETEVELEIRFIASAIIEEIETT